MWKVYKNDNLIGTFDKDIDAALCATNAWSERIDKVEVYGPKSDYIHFIEGDKPND